MPRKLQSHQREPVEPMKSVSTGKSGLAGVALAIICLLALAQSGCGNALGCGGLTGNGNSPFTGCSGGQETFHRQARSTLSARTERCSGQPCPTPSGPAFRGRWANQIYNRSSARRSGADPEPSLKAIYVGRRGRYARRGILDVFNPQSDSPVVLRKMIREGKVGFCISRLLQSL